MLCLHITNCSSRKLLPDLVVAHFVELFVLAIHASTKLRAKHTHQKPGKDASVPQTAFCCDPAVINMQHGLQSHHYTLFRCSC